MISELTPEMEKISVKIIKKLMDGPCAKDVQSLMLLLTQNKEFFKTNKHNYKEYLD